MKKIISIIVILIVVWFGLIFYANSTTEGKLKDYTTKVNKMYAEMDLGITFNLSKYESTFFTANASYEIKIDPNKLLKGMNPYFMFLNESEKNEIYGIFDKPITINQKISYGPVFFDNGLEFGRAKTTFKAELSELVVKLANKFNNHIGENSSMRIDESALTVITESMNKYLKQPVEVEYSSVLALLSSDTTMKASISKIEVDEVNEYSGKKEGILVEPITMESTYNIDDFTGDMNINIPFISFVDRGIEKLNIKNINLDYDITEFINAMHYFGNFAMSVDEVSVYLSKREGEVKFAGGVFVDMIKNKDPKLTDMQMKVKAEVLQYPNDKPPFDLPKTAEFNFDLLGFNNAELATAYYKFEDYMYGEMLDFDNPNVRKPKEFFIEEIRDHIGKIIIKDKTKLNFGLDIATEKMPDTHNTANLNINYVLGSEDLEKLIDLMIASANEMEIMSLALKAFTANLDIAVHKDIIKPVEMFLAMPKQIGMIKEDGDMLITKVEYKDGKVLINGKENPAINQQLQMILPPK